MERYCSTGQSPQRAIAPKGEEEEFYRIFISIYTLLLLRTFRQPCRPFHPVVLILSFTMQTQNLSASVSNILFTLSALLHIHACICAVLRFIHAYFDIKLALVFVKKNILLNLHYIPKFLYISSSSRSSYPASLLYVSGVQGCVSIKGHLRRLLQNSFLCLQYFLKQKYPGATTALSKVSATHGAEY
jgi:hypothetical protein